jgi:hypothetical protein
MCVPVLSMHTLGTEGVEIRWELPPDRMPACMLQQQLSEKSPQAVNRATHRAWAQEYGVICLSGMSTFYTIDGADQPQFWPPDALREALKPSGGRSDPAAHSASKLWQMPGRGCVTLHAHLAACCFEASPMNLL